MSMLSEQAKELRRQADVCECFIGSLNYAKHFRQAADTIESLSAKLAAANMECSSEYYGKELKDAKETIKKLLTGDYESACEFCAHNNDEDTKCAKIPGYGDWCCENAKYNGSMERSERYYGGGWIPCSERLPKAGHRYLVSAVWTDKDFKCYRVYDAVYGDDGIWHAENYSPVSYGVLAWMPLPEPYKPDGEMGE